VKKVTGETLKVVFIVKLGCFCYKCNCVAKTSTPASRVENSAQVMSCQLVAPPKSTYDETN
jgi:hypothetical protein